MTCKECPLNMTCMAGRLGADHDLVSLCPGCGRLYMLRREETTRPRNARIASDPFDREYDAVYIQRYATNTMVALRCEKRLTTRKDRLHWKEVRDDPRRDMTERARISWSREDPATGDALIVRPCPECTVWPDPYLVDDLDEKAVLDEERQGSRSAFCLKNKD